MKDTYPISGTSEAAQLAHDIRQVINARISEATEEKVLTNRNGKILRVMREPDGSKYVSREYGEQSELVGDDYWASVQNFTQRWNRFIELYKNAPFSIVPSSVVRDESDRAHVISEHREDVVPLRDATLETKSAIVGYLTTSAVSGVTDGPAYATIQHDMFNVIRADDELETVELLDVDPYLPIKYGNSHASSAIVEKLIDLIADMTEAGWSKSESERTELARVIVRKMIECFPGDKLDELFDLDNDLSVPFSTAHLLTNGVDARRWDKSQ